MWLVGGGAVFGNQAAEHNHNDSPLLLFCGSRRGSWEEQAYCAEISLSKPAGLPYAK